jgi:hypothetical protein
MAIFAVLDNNSVVTNVIVCESLELAEEVMDCVCVEVTGENPGGIGWAYDGTKFIAPQPTEEPTE